MVNLVGFSLVATAAFLIYYSVYAILLILSADCPKNDKSKALASVAVALLLAVGLLFGARKLSEAWDGVEEEFAQAPLADVDRFAHAEHSRYWAQRTMTTTVAAVILFPLVFLWMRMGTLGPLEKNCTLKQGTFWAKARDALKSIEFLVFGVAVLLALSLYSSIRNWRAFRQLDKDDERTTKKQGRKDALEAARQARLERFGSGKNKKSNSSSSDDDDDDNNDEEDEEEDAANKKTKKEEAENKKKKKEEANKLKNSKSVDWDNYDHWGEIKKHAYEKNPGLTVLGLGTGRLLTKGFGAVLGLGGKALGGAKNALVGSSQSQVVTHDGHFTEQDTSVDASLGRLPGASVDRPHFGGSPVEFPLEGDVPQQTQAAPFTTANVSRHGGSGASSSVSSISSSSHVGDHTQTAAEQHAAGHLSAEQHSTNVHTTGSHLHAAQTAVAEKAKHEKELHAAISQAAPEHKAAAVNAHAAAVKAHAAALQQVRSAGAANKAARRAASDHAKATKAAHAHKPS